MLFEEMGATLRELREGKGLSLEEVSRYIKINERTLIDIENGNLEALPRTVYTKGFIRTYSKFMGMSAADINSVLDEHFPSEQENVKAVMSPVFTGKTKHSRKSTLFMFVLLGVLALGAWYTYFYVLKNSAPPPSAPAIFHNESSIAAIANSNHLPNVPAGRSNSSAGNFSAGVSAAHPAAASNSTSAPNIAPAVSGVQGSASPLVGPLAAPLAGSSGQSAGLSSGQSSGQSEATSSASSASASSTSSGQDTEGVYFNQQSTSNSTTKKHRVVITATAECWIKAVTDAGDERPFNLPKNQSSVFTFNKFLKLRLGNAAGVKIRYDGEDFPVPPGDGNTRDIVFPPSR